MSELKKSIGFKGLIALGAAGVIGSSWIYTNGSFFAKYGAGGEIFGLLIATAIAVCISLAYAELATAFPRAGGEVVFTYVAFGKRLSFTAGWALIGAYLSCLAFYVTATGLLLSKIFPQLSSGPHYTIAGVSIYLPELLFGVALTVIIFLLNYFGVNITSKVQEFLFVVMILLGAVLAVVGFSHGSPSNFWPAFSKNMNPALSIIRFILPAMTFLTGFSLIAVMAEEADMPAKKIGISVVVSILLAGGFYILVLLSSAWILPWQKTATYSMGTIDTFTKAGFPALGYMAFAISCLGLFTSFVGLFAAAPRLVLSLARANMLSKKFTKLHKKYGTPTNALWLILILTLGFGWLGKGAMLWFLDMGGLMIAVAWVLTVLSLLKIRKKYPRLPKAFQVPSLALPAIGGFMAIFVALATLIPGTSLSLVWPYEYIILLVWIALGLVLYLISRSSHKSSDEENLKELLGSQYQALKASQKGEHEDE